MIFKLILELDLRGEAEGLEKLKQNFKFCFINSK